MPRLLILCEYPTLLGGERSMLATLDAVRAAGFDVHVAAPAEGLLADALRDRGVPHLPWQVQDAGGQRLPLEHLREGLASLIAGTRPAAVHANSLSTARIAGPVVAHECVPGVAHLRDIVTLSAQAVNDLNCHERIIAVSHATREFHVAQRIHAAKCVVIHNGVDLHEFQPREPGGSLHSKLRLSANARLVATIGQVGLRKGTDVALAAMSRVMAQCADLHWLVVGERTSDKQEARDFEQRLRAVAAEPPLTGRVHFLGNRNDVPQLMNECVLLVHTARQEPLGRVMLEAAASGLAVVATDAGGAREIFPRELDGAVLVPVDDPAAVADAVGALLADAARRQVLSAGARRRAEEAFDICDSAARLIMQYRELVGC